MRLHGQLLRGLERRLGRSSSKRDEVVERAFMWIENEVVMELSLGFLRTRGSSEIFFRQPSSSELTGNFEGFRHSCLSSLPKIASSLPSASARFHSGLTEECRSSLPCSVRNR